MDKTFFNNVSIARKDRKDSIIHELDANKTDVDIIIRNLYYYFSL